MRRTNLPKICSKDLFVKCAERISNAENRETLLGHQDDIEELNSEYVEFAKALRLYEFGPEEDFWNVPLNTWNNLYTNHMSKQKGIARADYNTIKLAPAGDTCPYCSVHPIHSVDHFLPKSQFPQYSVMPVNLVGCCRDCNKEKSARCATVLDDQLFQPYFESINSRWLTAEVREETPPSVTYHVDPSHGLDEMKARRAQNQFDMLKLGHAYAMRAAEELSSIEYSLNEIHERSGSEEVRGYLARAAESSRHASNPIEWKVALYEALAQSDWFCDGGFRFYKAT